MSLGPYLMMKYLPREEQPKYVTAWVFAFLSWHHMNSFLYNFGGYAMDISTYSMLLTAKLHALAWCYRDGGVKDQEKNLYESQVKWQVKEMPGLLEYWSYVFYGNACALGVFFEFSDYKRFIEKTGEYKNSPSPILPTLEYVMYGLICLGFHLLGAH